MKIFPIIYSIVFMLLISGCATERFIADEEEVKKNTIYSTQVSLGRCAYLIQGQETLPALAPIAEIIASSVIKTGVNRIQSALSEAAKEKTFTATASRNFEHQSKEEFGPCIQVVRGLFYLDQNRSGIEKPANDDSDISLSKVPGWVENYFSDKTGGKFATLWNNGLWLAGPPDFIFEGVFRASSNKKALTIAPVHVRMERPIATRVFRSDSARHVALYFAFHKLSGTIGSLNHENNPGSSVIIGKLQPGNALDFNSKPIELFVSGSQGSSNGDDTPVPNNTAGSRIDLVSDDAVGSSDSNNSARGIRPGGFNSGTGATTISNRSGPANTKNNSDPGKLIIGLPFETDWFALDKTVLEEPLTIKALVAETQRKSEFLSFLAAVVEDSKTDLTKELQNQLIPSKREAAEATIKDTEDTNANAFDEKFSEAIQALDACAKATKDSAQVASGARTKMRSANKAARKANQPEKFTDDKVNSIKINDSLANIKASCEAVLNEFASS